MVTRASAKNKAACSVCKKPFKAKNSRQHLCSEECRKEDARQRTSTYRKENGERVKLAKKRCYKKRKEYYLEKAKLYSIENYEKVKEAKKRHYDKQNPYRIILQEAGITELCVVCSSRKSGNNRLSVHHVDGNHYNNELNNLVWICESCHQFIHNSEGIHSELISIEEAKSRKRM